VLIVVWSRLCTFSKDLGGWVRGLIDWSRRALLLLCCFFSFLSVQLCFCVAFFSGFVPMRLWLLVISPVRTVRSDVALFFRFSCLELDLEMCLVPPFLFFVGRGMLKNVACLHNCLGLKRTLHLVVGLQIHVVWLW
jgi:hypothetical protein